VEKNTEKTLPGISQLANKIGIKFSSCTMFDVWEIIIELDTAADINIVLSSVAGSLKLKIVAIQICKHL